ncbi:Karyogamy protein, KAR9 [Cordyceps fumosorosea ARSEF 2679]|uniref:Karyogamy protein, KAR9 n=1 Tax=Cordyceps fumosorosea (strain ARSEF 2679) TaxID=1081104 RepID=A0A162JSU8_CORFA|nr:Karyogamy protein, KAR9 [Cordyceps fumosorosea ARSEF 2679]OAA73262.1 Karyogamy protein, KAR9 [Cordyceps fumosorosea ARSEF 2679]
MAALQAPVGPASPTRDTTSTTKITATTTTQLTLPPRVHTVPKPLPSGQSPPHPHSHPHSQPHIRIQRPHSHIDLRGHYETDAHDLSPSALGFANIYTIDLPALPSLSTSWSGSSISIGDDSTSASTLTREQSVSTTGSPIQPATSTAWSCSSSRTRDADDALDHHDNTPTPTQTPIPAAASADPPCSPIDSARPTSGTSATVRQPAVAPKAAPAASESITTTTAASHRPGPTARPLSAAPSTTSTAPSTTPSFRKPAPGLAARLKALGFGSSKKSSPNLTPPTELVGRLDEQQLRQLDEKHIAGSISSVISRRGRPWRGAGASSTLKVSVSQPNLRPASAIPDQSPRLPEIEPPDPLEMDTQKYRLPDHTNGNGTKVTLETRREHLERQPPPPSSDLPATPPPPPPKDTPPPPVTPPPAADYVPGLGSYFTPGRNRPGSIYTLSRASFANQLAQLTSLQLPDAHSLSSKVSAIPTAAAATNALINAAEQIRSWISKAQEVIGGLDSEDDVEWAAAGGREGLGDVESAIVRFEELINAYVSAIEELQQRDDASQVPKQDTNQAVSQMEIILDEWSKIKSTLHSVRGQVEIAMEWEELWSNVLGDIQSEMDELSRLVFEMEERRHKTIIAGAGGDNVDIGDLETIVEDGPVTIPHVKSPGRLPLSTGPLSPSSPSTVNAASPGLSQDDSSLLALFARMQPLRASLDFLPMRLSVFETRAENIFPTACDELTMRRTGLDNSYRKLEKDAESLRKELGEDRWVIVFRGAGRQAQKMQQSVERSLLKLREGVDARLHLTNPPAMTKKIESYEAKKVHYGPAIERVLSIIDRGVKDRLTVNGEILRLHHDLQSRWSHLKQSMQETGGIVEAILADNRSKQLRDSVSSLLSNDRSTVGSGHETPGSSPPSSVIMTSLGFEAHTPTASQSKARSPNAPPSSGRRYSSLPEPASAFSKRQAARLSTIPSSSAGTPVQGSTIPRPTSTLDNRPRWNTSTKTGDLDAGYRYPNPHTLSTPNRRASSTASPGSTGSKLPTMRSIFHRSVSESPQVERSPSRTSNSRLGFRDRLVSPGPYSQHTLAKKSTTPGAATGTRRTSLQPPRAGHAAAEEDCGRPSSSLASHRESLLPRMPGRSSPMMSRRKDSVEPRDSKPRWRF